MRYAIDLYSGIGGWTLGMKLSGIKNLASYEWWSEANQTHNLNFNTNHKEINIREIDVKKLEFSKKIDFVVGSPPCTQFSFANRGGNGNISDGLVDIYKFLEIVECLKPKYWAMENVPRVAEILEKELNDGILKRFKSLVKVIKVIDAADYGVPQNRKRMIAGNFPVSLFESYKKNIHPVTLGDVIKATEKNTIIDPNYGYEIKRTEVTELENEADLTAEEERINRDSKTFHPVYNRMSFPDQLDRPSRTVTATCTRVSRESIIVKSKSGFRRLNVRERGIVQGFPITYQFYGRTLNAKFKMIGNAVPPILTYYIFQSMLEVSPEKIKAPRSSNYYHKQPEFKSFKSNLSLPVKKYPINRKFMFSVPNLRYGSGVRFELSNTPSEKTNKWSFKFYFGNSKKIKQIKLDDGVKNFLAPIVNTTKNAVFNDCIEEILKKHNRISSDNLQKLWVSQNSKNEVFNFLDDIGSCVERIMKEADFNDIDNTPINAILREENRKMSNNKNSVLTGFYFLSTLNQKLLK